MCMKCACTAVHVAVAVSSSFTATCPRFQGLAPAHAGSRRYCTTASAHEMPTRRPSISTSACFIMSCRVLAIAAPLRPDVADAVCGALVGQVPACTPLAGAQSFAAAQCNGRVMCGIPHGSSALYQFFFSNDPCVGVDKTAAITWTCLVSGGAPDLHFILLQTCWAR